MKHNYNYNLVKRSYGFDIMAMGLNGEPFRIDIAETADEAGQIIEQHKQESAKTLAEAVKIFGESVK